MGPLLSLLSGPRAVWRACPALGSFFSVLTFFLGLALVLALASIYPIVASARQQGGSTAPTYRCCFLASTLGPACSLHFCTSQLRQARSHSHCWCHADCNSTAFLQLHGRTGTP